MQQARPNAQIINSTVCHFTCLICQQENNENYDSCIICRDAGMVLNNGVCTCRDDYTLEKDKCGKISWGRLKKKALNLPAGTLTPCSRFCQRQLPSHVTDSTSPIRFFLVLSENKVSLFLRRLSFLLHTEKNEIKLKKKKKKIQHESQRSTYPLHP